MSPKKVTLVYSIQLSVCLTLGKNVVVFQFSNIQLESIQPLVNLKLYPISNVVITVTTHWSLLRRRGRCVRNEKDEYEKTWI